MTAAPDLTRRSACAAGLGTLACGIASAWPRRATAAATDWLPAPPLPRTPMLDHHGRAVLLQDAIVGIVIVSFFFNGCQTVCPPQTALLRDAQRRLRTRGRAGDLRMVAITVDPLGDGPAQLRDYARRFDLPLAARGVDDGWLLLTGERADVGRVLAAFGVPAGLPGDHPSLLWLGDTARGRWTRTSSLNPPEALVALVEAVRA
ncbi:SCO family protein [Variovorax sp. RHLX14]|uniref:SCO family protein n=1 Tax=Variovorax sp. RHLX14 TaxID=1259731 RepID=UPI003F4885E1